MLTQLKQRIKSRQAVVGIIGLGYVGLPLLSTFHRAGFPVIGFDNDPAKIVALRAGKNYLPHLGERLVHDLLARGHFQASDDFTRLAEADVVISCVPTPLGKHLEPDLSYVERTSDDIGRTLRPGQLVVLESTTYPGTTRDVMLPRLLTAAKKTGTELVCGRDFFVAYSPEREDPGRRDFDTQSIPKLVGGIDAASGEMATLLYAQAVKKVVPVSSCEVAESAKLLENIYRAVNIALVNEMKVVMTAMGIDIWEVIAAAATKPFGFQAFWPGPGLGGHCIPIDPFYLTWKAREVGQPTRFIELAGEINHQMPRYVVERVVLALSDKARKAVRGSRVLVLGLAYKPDINDVRESPSFELIELLENLGADVDYHDPHVPHTHKMRHYDLQMHSIALTPQSLGAYDCVLVATHHSAYDWQSIANHARLIVDTRNALAHVTGSRDHIVRA